MRFPSAIALVGLRSGCGLGKDVFEGVRDM